MHHLASGGADLAPWSLLSPYPDGPAGSIQTPRGEVGSGTDGAARVPPQSNAGRPTPRATGGAGQAVAAACVLNGPDPAGTLARSRAALLLFVDTGANLLLLSEAEVTNRGPSMRSA